MKPRIPRCEKLTYNRRGKEEGKGRERDGRLTREVKRGFECRERLSVWQEREIQRENNVNIYE